MLGGPDSREMSCMSWAEPPVDCIAKQKQHLLTLAKTYWELLQRQKPLGRNTRNNTLLGFLNQSKKFRVDKDWLEKFHRCINLQFMASEKFDENEYLKSLTDEKL